MSSRGLSTPQSAATAAPSSPPRQTPFVRHYRLYHWQSLVKCLVSLSIVGAFAITEFRNSLSLTVGTTDSLWAELNATYAALLTDATTTTAAAKSTSITTLTGHSPPPPPPGTVLVTDPSTTETVQSLIPYLGGSHPDNNHNNDNNERWLVWVTLTSRQPTQFVDLVRTSQALAALPQLYDNNETNDNHDDTTNQKRQHVNVYWVVVELLPRASGKKSSSTTTTHKPSIDELMDQKQEQYPTTPQNGECSRAVREYVLDTIQEAHLPVAHLCWKDIVVGAADSTLTQPEQIQHAVHQLVTQELVADRQSNHNHNKVTIVYGHSGTAPLLLNVGRLYQIATTPPQHNTPNQERRASTARTTLGGCMVQQPHSSSSSTADDPTNHESSWRVESWLPRAYCSSISNRMTTTTTQAPWPCGFCRGYQTFWAGSARGNELLRGEVWNHWW